MAIPEGLSFDELNKLYSREKEGNLRSMPFEQYFGEMELSQEQKDRRDETAMDVMAFVLIALEEMYLNYMEGSYGYMDVAEEMSRNYSSMLERMGIPLTAYFAAAHANDVATEIALATMNNSEDPYFYSEDRARLIAENEANSIWNDSEHQDAILTGKSRKTWHAIIDKVTRDTHKDINGTTVPINEPFRVGDSLLQYPRDESLGADPKEIVNCRCSVSYS